MNIVHIVWGLGIGGVESMLVDIANYQAQSHTVSIIVINDNISPSLADKLDSRIKLYPCKRKVGTKNPLPIIRLNLDLLRINPDVIHIHMEGIVRLVRIKRKATVVRTIHNITSIPNEYPKFDKLFAISKAVQKRTQNQGFESEVIYNGIHFNQIKCDAHTRGTPLRIVNVGRLENDKGQEVLIEAAKVLKEHGVDFSIDFIGSGKNEAELKELTKEYRLEDNINFLGFQSRTYVYENLCHYDLYVQPSIFEGFGLTIAEAIAAKVPVITSDLEGPIEVIDGGHYGIPFQCGNASDLAEKIMLFYNKEITIDTEAAWNFAHENFDINAATQKYLDAYESLAHR